MPYSGRSLHYQHEEMRMIRHIPQLKWLRKDVVQSTLKELVWSLAIGGMLAGAVVCLFK